MPLACAAVCTYVLRMVSGPVVVEAATAAAPIVTTVMPTRMLLPVSVTVPRMVGPGPAMAATTGASSSILSSARNASRP